MNINNNCGWKPIPNAPNAFENKNPEFPFPVFNFTFTNGSKKVILLTSIGIKAELLPIGLLGPHIPVHHNIYRPPIKYKIKIPKNKETITTTLSDRMELLQEKNTFFSIELYDETMEKYGLARTKYALYLIFGFDHNFYIETPLILLNSDKYYTKLSYQGLN